MFAASEASGELPPNSNFRVFFKSRPRFFVFWTFIFVHFCQNLKKLLVFLKKLNLTNLPHHIEKLSSGARKNTSKFCYDNFFDAFFRSRSAVL